MGPCAKQVVKATLITDTGLRFIGSNYCVTPQRTCPRNEAGYLSGQGYHLCKEICHQRGHAEENAIENAGPKAKGSVIYVEGHTYACENCQRVARQAGVVEIIIGSPP